MPRGDGTGPNGEGPQTGRAAGYCSGSNQPGYMNNVKRNFNNQARTANNRSSSRNVGVFGFGGGRGRRRGRGNGKGRGQGRRR